jgi:molybdopterin molybdotransferase
MSRLVDDCFAVAGTLLTAPAALDLIAARVMRVTEPERVPLREARGRVLASDVVAARDVPPHDNAAMDGYAVCAHDLDSGRETRLAVTGRVTAGHPLARPVGRGEAIRIFTGAAMPTGPDTVVMQEDCQLEGDTVIVPAGIAPGANCRHRGEDIRAGSAILRCGSRLRPQDIGLAASVGETTLEVSRRLRVALFSTGDEVREPGETLQPGCLYDSNRYTVSALLERLGASVTDLGILQDDAAAISEALARAAEPHDLIITSGGVSVGEEDHVKTVVQQLGQLHLWRVAIKPGKPIALGQIKGVPFVGLPGNPVAVMVTFLRLVRPLVLRLMGCEHVDPVVYRVRAGFEHQKKPNRREWVRVRLERDDAHELVARKFPREGAGILSSVVAADGLVELAEDVTEVERGTMVDFLPFTELDASC